MGRRALLKCWEFFADRLYLRLGSRQDWRAGQIRMSIFHSGESRLSPELVDA